YDFRVGRLSRRVISGLEEWLPPARGQPERVQKPAYSPAGPASSLSWPPGRASGSLRRAGITISTGHRASSSGTAYGKNRDLGRAGGSPLFGMCPDKKIRQDSGPPSALFAILPPRPAGSKMGLSRKSLNADFVAFKKDVAEALHFEVHAQLRVDDVANRQRTGG